jgi:RecJ-like exonuclease
LIIAMEMMEQMINHKINRKLKHVWAIAYISGAWGNLTPYIAASQDFPAIGERLKKLNVGFPISFI